MYKINIQFIHKGEDYYKIADLLTKKEYEVSIKTGDAIKMMIRSIKIVMGNGLE